ncbi:hypothetical protein BS47DRAFT_1366790 [Hydnum rufescens UP504]|uniref:Uncharacterized protein n=1 Tax=Hydnum rufescens UP504 TaxID=1448309 RepID=A0A9P6AK51_9AGAM|nr:hypothetical protein BS47DRAFT_1366790 [Hydnum rufescens UP504]
MATPTARPMPRPSAKDAPYFKGKQIESFLTDYEACCDEALYDDIKKCENLARYCNDDARELIKNHPEVKGGSLKALSERLCDFYGLSDRRQKYTQERLAKFCYHSRSIKSEADLDEYYHKFVTQVQHLAKKGHLPKSSSKLLIAHKKSKAKKSYYKHKSDSDSSSSSSSDSSDDESPAKEPESDSDSEVPV